MPRSPRSTAGIGVGVACVAAALLFALWNGAGRAPAPPPEAPPPAPSVTASVPPAPPAAQPLVEPPAEDATPVVISEPAAPGEAVGQRRPRFRVDDLRDEMMASNPDLAQFRTLQRKVLLKPEEREQLRGIYKDRARIEVARRDLLAESEQTYSDDNQFRRMYRVEYLGMALEWKDNPERAHLLDTVESLVMARNIRSTQDLDVRRSLSGDKVEMMMILLHNDRARAEQLLAQSRGTPYEPLLEYARVRFDALWALARQQQTSNP
ncbi:hypothetical protein SAMN04488504_109144 [Myxococcus virescens]|uniref:Uncharacterized protein n=1 Tax=Myxococcus virescens TaxID=83456 RepID=A0ABY0MZC6_9BACT|nr:hypothetical protein SAMN04488504_109144 [Myxococcus virescens]